MRREIPTLRLTAAALAIGALCGHAHAAGAREPKVRPAATHRAATHPAAAHPTVEAPLVSHAGHAHAGATGAIRPPPPRANGARGVSRTVASVPLIMGPLRRSTTATVSVGGPEKYDASKGAIITGIAANHRR